MYAHAALRLWQVMEIQRRMYLDGKHGISPAPNSLVSRLASLLTCPPYTSRHRVACMLSICLSEMARWRGGSRRGGEQMRVQQYMGMLDGVMQGLLSWGAGTALLARHLAARPLSSLFPHRWLGRCSSACVHA